VSPSSTVDRSCAACVAGYSTTVNATCTPWSRACVSIEALPPTATRDRTCYDGWSKTQGSRTRGEQGWALALIAGGDAIVGGEIDRVDNPAIVDIDEYAFIRRIDKTTSNVVWERRVGGISLNRVRGLAADSAGFVYAVGYAYSNLGAGTQGDADIFVIKLAVADGAVSWIRDFGTSAFDLGAAIALAPDGNLLIAGYTAGALAGPRVATGPNSDSYVSKLSSADGSMLWQTQFGPGGADGIAVDSKGDAFVAGAATVTVPSPEGSGSFTVHKLSGSTGGQLWAQRFGVVAGGIANAAVADAADDLFVSGADGAEHTLVMKLAGSDGHRLWSQQLGAGRTLDYYRGMALTSTGNVLVAGSSDGDLDGEGEKAGGYLFELSQLDGAVAWSEQFGAPYREHPRAVAQDGSGNLWLSGRRVVEREDPPTGTTRDNSFIAKIVR